MDEEVQKKQEVQKIEHAQGLSTFEEMERMFDRYLSGGWLRPFHREWARFPRMDISFEGKSPRVDVINRDDEVVVKAELPGVAKKDIDVSVTQNMVTIKATTSREQKEEKGEYYRCEISSGSYSRSLSLPDEVDEEKTRANFRDGILELTMPKLKKSKRRSIKID